MREVFDIDYERLRDLIQLMREDYLSARQDVYHDVASTKVIALNDGMVIGVTTNHWFHQKMSDEPLLISRDENIRYRAGKAHGTWIYSVEGPDWYYNVKFESALGRRRHGSSTARKRFYRQDESTFPMGTEKECANVVVYYYQDRNGIFKFDLVRTTQPDKYLYDRSVILLELRFRNGYDGGLPFAESKQPILPIPRTTIGQRKAANNDSSL